MPKKKWNKDNLRLAANHQWQAKPGYKIVVLDRGAVRFDIPQGWEFGPGDEAMEARDRPAPDDRCLLQVTLLRVPVAIRGGQASLVAMFEQITGDAGEEVIAREPITHEGRDDAAILWRETRFVDPGERREARSRTCLALGPGVQVVMTLSFWPEDAAWATPIWDDILASLRLGEYRDATTGRRIRSTPGRWADSEN